MRFEVKAFVELGPLPPVSADLTVIERAERALQAISAPITDDEAKALIGCFGEDDCFGLGWTLLHLIETAPMPLPETAPHEGDNPWLHLLYARIEAAT
ncbi:hypothetical protein [Antarctobacter sp.]|uniref:hypothetical protein n=1 Tax=Antarctobacter sp. TaxID=1872577 RepID=UPI002B267B3A|nr:hypothetical protein [Antarctobacter sp.]